MFTRDSAIDTIRSHGMRLTPQRLAVVDALISLRGTHPSAEQVATRVGDRVRGVSLSTIYKVLNEVADLNLVHRVTLDGSTRFDDNLDGHVHLTCQQCGAVVDLALPDTVGQEIYAVGTAVGAQVESVAISLDGRCASCIARSN